MELLLDTKIMALPKKNNPAKQAWTVVSFRIPFADKVLLQYAAKEAGTEQRQFVVDAIRHYHKHLQKNGGEPDGVHELQDIQREVVDLKIQIEQMTEFLSLIPVHVSSAVKQLRKK